MSTLLISGGQLVDELSVRQADVLIQDGRIQAILPPGQARAADSVFDARGLHVLPGVVDAHVHFKEPGRTEWEGLVSGTTAAAAGGVTTVCDMPLNCHPPTLDSRALALKRSAIAEHAVVDYAAESSPGILLALQAEDAMETQRRGERARSARTMGARLHFVHISTAGAARLIAEARSAGQDVSVETCPHYLLLDESDLERLGAFGKCAPPLRSRQEVEDLWQAVLDGAIDWIASDHSPCPPTMKQTDDIWSAWGGLGGVQTLLPALLSEGVHARGLSLPKLVSLIAGGPARRLGLYPRKGVLDPGSDADLVLVDLARDWTLQVADLRTRWPVNPFVGRSFRGQVIATLVRGTIVWRDGAARVAPGFGQPARA